MTSYDDETVEKIEDSLPAVKNESSLTVQVEQQRAIQEVQASIIIAKKFPRDEVAAFNSIIKSCDRYSLAEQAMYAFPRGKETVSGPSIRLAEVIAMNWENMDHGWEELERSNGKSKCIAYCWDKQKNNRKVIKFEVEHWIIVGKGQNKTRKVLTDPRDIYELCANQSSRRVRTCILANIPGDVVEAAVKACKKTLAKGNGETLEDRVRELVRRFAQVGVTQEMIEERLGHKMATCTADEVVDLIPILRSLVEKQKTKSDFFNVGEQEKQKSSVAEKLEEMRNANADSKP